MDRVIVKPELVRGLGNILSSKSLTDFVEGGSGHVSSGVDTVNGRSMTVYTIGG